MDMDLFPEGRCPDCKSYGGQWIDGKHLCTVYDGPPCEEVVRGINSQTGQPTVGKCGKPTVFVTVAAPGTGCGRVCEDNHFDGWSRELTLNEVR
jgi:hypothetical protein